MLQREYVQGPLTPEQQARYDFDKSLAWRLRTQDVGKKIFWGTILTLPLSVPVAAAITIVSAGITAPMTLGFYGTGLLGAGLTDAVFMPRSIENLFARGVPQGEKSGLVQAYERNGYRINRNVMREVKRVERRRVLSPAGVV